MENGLSSEYSNAMGATNEVNSAKLAVLHERKKRLEETLSKKTQELRQLCIQEAELTGVTPLEMPLEEGESLPLIRRRVGTTYELNENLVKNANKDELIADLELQIQLHANLAEAALGLANEQNISKTVKRQHNAEYRKHKSQCIALQEKLVLLKEQTRLKKKSRYNTIDAPADDCISVSTSITDIPIRNEYRASYRTNSMSSDHSDKCTDSRYNTGPINSNMYRTSEATYFVNPVIRHEDALTSGFYRLSLNGYNKYMERFESVNSPHYNRLSQYSILTNQNLQQYNVGMQQLSINLNSPQYLQHSPVLPHHSPVLYDTNAYMPKLSPSMPHQSRSVPQNSPQLQRSNPQHSPLSQHNTVQRLSSPSFSTRYQYYPQNIQEEQIYRQNPHQIQPHQQYENNGMTTGLGGCWKRSETGEMFWCNSNTVTDGTWYKGKRFGSLDRRKNKKIHKRISPVENKCATLATYNDPVRAAINKLPQVEHRRSQTHRQLVRTQSLGSVGAQTTISDDNSSCESDNRSINDARFNRRHKEKEWVETSLDGPVSPNHQVGSRCQSTVPSILAPEEKYKVNSPPILNQTTRSMTPKPLLEIPAESNPSPRLQDNNFEIFNNNIPKNCTVVQAGHCKPYHEETKPFEMSDFYKYSTKYKKSVETQHSVKSNTGFETTEINCQPFVNSNNNNETMVEPPRNLNTSLEIGGIEVSENFTAEMNAWYNNNEYNIDDNRSNATLV